MVTPIVGSAILAVTLVLFALIGMLYARGRVKGVEDYVAARHSIGTWRAAATFIASGMGAWILFSPAESATWGGLPAVVGYGIGSAAPLIAFAFIAPRIRNLMPLGHSVSEYVWYRYGLIMYVFVLGVTAFYMFIFLTAELTAIALTFSLVADLPLYVTAMLVGLAVVAYTAYGGLKASLITDNIQAVVLAVVLTVSFVATFIILGDPVIIWTNLTQSNPQLVDWGFRPGIEFAVLVTIAILAANLFHQGYWQRIWSCKDEKSLRNGFLIASVAVIPIVILPGFLGLVAQGMGAVTHPSIALLSMLLAILPELLLVAILFFALALTASSLDTLFNGIISLASTDVSRFRPRYSKQALLRWSKITTIILAAPAIYIAAQGFSVLYLFLLADLICAAAAVPVFLGLYSGRPSGHRALIASAAGLSVGVIFFVQNELLLAFLAAFFLPALISFATLFFGKKFDLKSLRERVNLID